MFELKNVSKKFGKEYALNDITLSIGKGLNFITGASGSGKTTLLKIISGMETEFEGEVLYCGKSIKAMKEQEKSYFYNNIFGFIWQDFNLLEDLTVMENIVLPQYLKENQDKKAIQQVLRELKISEFASQKVKYLSGGQKQRVAIARELIKNPEVIIADEPTSALDEKSAKIIMKILQDLAKTKLVIVVTHNTSFIDHKSKQYELDKGELISQDEPELEQIKKINKKSKYSLSFLSACNAAITGIKGKWGRFAVIVLSIFAAADLLLITASGAITGNSKSAFDELFEMYGEGILDIELVGSFMSASGGSEDKPNANVSQDIAGLYEKYKEDKRIEYSVFLQAFNDISITINQKEYQIQSSNSVPSANKIIAGRMPKSGRNEVVVPESFVKKLGIKEKEILDQTILFSGAIYNWDSGSPVLKSVNTEAVVVGVVDTTVIYEFEGQKFETSIDDSFFFSKEALDEMRNQAQITNANINFALRAKTPADLIALKDEINAMGIVPLGRFELVEDTIRLGSQTKEQSKAAIIVIAILAVVTVIVVSLISSFLRRREYAIYKVSGYSKKHLTKLTFMESIFAAGFAAAVFLLGSPITNQAVKKLWSVEILSIKNLGFGIVLVGGLGLVSFIIAITICLQTQITTALKTGEK